MKNVKNLEAKALSVLARELGDCDPKPHKYTFKVWEFSNGLILVPCDSTNDYFFADRFSIEPNGSAIVESVEETGEISSWTTEELLRAVQESMKEFGVDSVPKKHAELWRK